MSAEAQAAQIAERVVTEVARSTGATRRYLVAIAGPPASGKSTVAEALAKQLRARGYSSVVVPMDGFHLDNAVLRARGLLERKGAPETFDLDGFQTLIEKLRAGGAVAAPTFDRGLDRVVPGQCVVDAKDQIIVIEGNYLLLDEPGWRDLAALWDFSIFLDVPLPELENRLVERWVQNGHDPEAARTRAMSNDIPNANRISKSALAPDQKLIA